MISGQYRSFFIAWKSICNNSRKKDLNDIIFYDLRNVDKRREKKGRTNGCPNVKFSEITFIRILSN